MQQCSPLHGSFEMSTLFSRIQWSTCVHPPGRGAWVCAQRLSKLQACPEVGCWTYICSKIHLPATVHILSTLQCVERENMALSRNRMEAHWVLPPWPRGHCPLIYHLLPGRQDTSRATVSVYLRDTQPESPVGQELAATVPRDPQMTQELQSVPSMRIKLITAKLKGGHGTIKEAQTKTSHSLQLHFAPFPPVLSPWVLFCLPVCGTSLRIQQEWAQPSLDREQLAETWQLLCQLHLLLSTIRLLWKHSGSSVTSSSCQVFPIFTPHPQLLRTRPQESAVRGVRWCLVVQTDWKGTKPGQAPVKEL